MARVSVAAEPGCGESNQNRGILCGVLGSLLLQRHAPVVLLLECIYPSFKVFCIRPKLLTLEVVVPKHHLPLDPETIEECLGHMEALKRARSASVAAKTTAPEPVARGKLTVKTRQPLESTSHSTFANTFICATSLGSKCRSPRTATLAISPGVAELMHQHVGVARQEPPPWRLRCGQPRCLDGTLALGNPDLRGATTSLWALLLPPGAPRAGTAVRRMLAEGAAEHRAPPPRGRHQRAAPTARLKRFQGSPTGQK
eukprot:scaffold3181_cov389-Prasinococcus_capsulatus_cf.AAC.15